MQNNITLQTITHTGCVGFETCTATWLSTSSVSSVLSFLGNLVASLIVFKNKELSTSTNYFVVNMLVWYFLSVIFWSRYHLFDLNKLDHVSQFVINLFCKFLSFITDVSYGVSILSLVVIKVYIFNAVMFVMGARVQNVLQVISSNPQENNSIQLHIIPQVCQHS